MHHSTKDRRATDVPLSISPTGADALLFLSSEVVEVEQYPRLTEGPGFGPATIWANDALLMVLQASQGLTAPEIEAVSVQALPRSIVIHVCLRETSQAVTEELDDLVAGTEALLVGIIEPMVDIDVSIHIGESGPGWPGYLHRRLYMAHPRVRPPSST